MSNRDSMGFGDLIPQDVVDIFAHEKHNKRGRKQRSHSLGRALGWLKGKKKKEAGAKGQNLGLGPALDLALDGHKGGLRAGRQTHPQGNSHAVPKIHDDDKTPAPPHVQENVFAEASRPKYLEDLHSEALEGLKLMQQEETSNGVEFQDNESTVSTMDVQTDGESTGFMTDSTIADSSSVISAKSSISTRSSRSGLTRQGSTFRPLNSENKPEKKKVRRRQRKSVEGIPKHVQKELGLDRVGWILTPKLDEEELHNGEILESPTSEGPSSELDSGTALSKVEHAAPKDDLALLHHMGPDLSGGPRPRSVAVPSMTTANSLQEPPSPVITTSPQAAYMSKIIPNAILPPSIEVVEISRGRSRSSLRTVSKGSLVQPSPAPSRASSRASSTRTISSRESSSYPPTSNNPTDSSGWSHSDSSETLVSDSSTISSSSTPRQKSQDEADRFPIKPSTSMASKPATNGKVIRNGEHVKKDGTFSRSLSVMKPKRAPPPPSRSYSLHKAKRRSRDLADLRVVTGASPLQSISASGEENEKSVPVLSTVDSPGYHGDTSSLDDSAGSLSPYESKIFGDKFTTKDVLKDTLQAKMQTSTVSPSSGYSSQDGTSPQVAMQLPGSSPKHKKGIFAKLQRLFPGTPSATPPSITPTEALDPKNNQQLLVDPASLSPSVRALREIFNIPPHPKVHAPPPPPPEVWVHSRRSVELLLGPPVPENLPAIIKKNPKDRRQLRNVSGQTEGSARGPATKTKTVKVEQPNGVAQVSKKAEESVLLDEAPTQSSEKVNEKVDLNGHGRVTDEKVRASEMLNEMLVKAAEKRDDRLTAVKVDESRKNSRAELVPPISLARRSPSPSPPPSHHPPQPPGKLSAKAKAVSPESSWPPPPPPVAEAVCGQDDLDFPLPPPPVLSEESLVVPVAVPANNTVTGPAAPIPIVITECFPPTSPSQEAALTALNIPPPPSYSAPPPPVKLVSPAIPKKVLLPPVPEIVPLEVILPEPKDICSQQTPPVQIVSSPPKSHPPPPESSQETSKDLPTNKVICPPPDLIPETPKAQPPPFVEELPEEVPKEGQPEEAVMLPPPSQIVPPPPIDIPEEPSPPQSPTVLPTVVTVAASTPESPPPQVIEVSCIPMVGHTLLPSEEPAPQTFGLQPPQSIPPPPPIAPSLPQEEEPTQQMEQPPDVPEQNPSPSDVVPSPEPAGLVTDHQSSDVTSQDAAQETEEVVGSPESETPVIQEEPETSPSTVAPSSEEEKTPEPCVPSAVPEEPPVVSPSLLDMVKLRSAPEAPKTLEEAQTEASAASESINAASSTNEPPQKPIRKSLILLSPSSPPTIITTEPPVPKSQSLVLNPPSSPGVTRASKSPTAVTAAPSMNLQEVIRMRTAARSKESPGARISLKPPTSPMNLQRSPTNTASFVFSKSNLPVSPPAAQKPAEVLSKISDAETQKKVKMPPPVAKKPKAKVAGMEASEEEHAPGGQSDTDQAPDSSEKANGTISVAADGT